MGNETLVENWNSIIPHKIKVSELEHPTESFVFRCLLSFFRMMKYDMQEFESMYNESKDSTFQKRTQLVAHINHFYQLCVGSKQHTFFYVDLIKPSPKKTIHVLNHLLNYLFYVNMVRDDTIERATACTAKYQELSVRMNQKQREIEDRKIKMSNIEQNINKMADQVPQLERKNEKLREQKKELQEKLAAIRAADAEFVEKAIKLKADFATMRDQRVEDDEAAALIQKNEELELEIAECERQEKNLQQTNSEYATFISKIKPCILEAERILQNPLDNTLKSLKNELDTLQLNCHRLEVDHANKKTVLEALQKNCEAIRKYVDEKSKELAACQKQKRKTERQTVSDLSEKQLQLDDLTEQNELYTGQIAALRDEIRLILQMADDAMRFLMRDGIATKTGAGRKFK